MKLARLYLKKTLSGFVPNDEPSREAWAKYKLNEVYRSDVVKPRSYLHHKLCFALLTLTYQNQDKYTNFEHFRKAVALAAGHVETLVTIEGEVINLPGSLSYENLDEVQFTDVFGAMMNVCTSILGMSAPELEHEVSKYASDHYGAAA